MIYYKSREAFIAALTAYLKGKGWRVRFTGTGACVFWDLKEVHLPAAILLLWNKETTLSQDQRQKLLQKARVYGVHECIAHGLYTDTSHPRPQNKTTRHIYQGIEDVRAEYRVSEDYPGAFLDLKEGARLLADEGRFDFPLDQPSDSLGGYIVCYGRALIGQGLEDKRDRLAPAVESFLGQHVMSTLNRMLDEVPNLPDTTASIKLAEKIYAMLEEAAQNPSQEEPLEDESGSSNPSDVNPQSQPSQGNAIGNEEGQEEIPEQEDEENTEKSGDNISSSDSPDKEPSRDADTNQNNDQDGDGNGSNHGSSSNNKEKGNESENQCQDSSNTSGSGCSEPNRNNQGEQDVKNPSNPKDKAESNNSPDTSRQASDPEILKQALKELFDADIDLGAELEKAMREALGDKVVDDAANDPGLEMPAEEDLSFGPLGGNETGRNQRGPLTDLSEMKVATSKILGHMTTLLQAMRLQDSPPMSSGNRLDRRRSLMLPCGQTKVFKRRLETEAVNTAIQILVDGSYSMGEDGSMLACSAAHVITDAIWETPGVAISTAVFPWETTGSVDDIGIITPWGAKPKASKGYAYSAGGTPTGQAVAWATVQLMQRDETRKLMIICTDGAPNYLPTALTNIEQAKQLGIEVFGIGIGVDQYSLAQFAAMFGKKGTLITSVADLPKALIEILENALVPNGR